jgi:class 3 adenylate cyclase
MIKPSATFSTVMAYRRRRNVGDDDLGSGLLVIGDIVGSGQAQERGVVGETSNLAARLQGLAAPNTMVIAEGTRRLSATSSN